MKVVLDTMYWVSYCTRPGGYRRRLIDRALARRVRLFVSEHILEELARVLTDDLGLSARFATLARRAVLRAARQVDLPPNSESFVPGDPDDDPIMLTAIASSADYLVTADAEILKVGKCRSVVVLKGEDWESILAASP